MNIEFLCTKNWIVGDVPHQIWEATTADGPAQNVFLTRLLHNKLLFYLNNFLRCYLSYLSPDFVTRAFTILGLALFLFGLYQAVRLKNIVLVVLLLLAPLSPLFSFPKDNLYQGVIIYSLLGLVILFGIYRLILEIKKLTPHAL